MKISLIEAGRSRDGLPWKAWTGSDGRFAVPAVGLVSLASLARDGDEVEIIDEKVSGPADDVRADLVGISFKTMDSGRAYELGDALRARGVTVVMGGLHASLLPQEAGQHADIVVRGEGEPVWRQVLDDVERGVPKPVYGCPDPQPIDTLLPQLVDLIDNTKYLCHGVQTARGCSLNCEFCPTRAMFGEGFRLRSVDGVANEVERLLSIEEKPIFFTDDVFGAGHMDFIRDITGRLKGMSAQYAVICDLRMVNAELISTLAETGCVMMCFDIFGGGAPEEKEMVKAIQAAGIRVLAYIMFGFEHQGPDVFRRTVDFVKECDIKHISTVLLTPYAGTAMAKRLEAEGRLLSQDWDRYDQTHVVFEPANMTAEELEDGFRFVLDEIGDRYDVEKVMNDVKGSDL